MRKAFFAPEDGRGLIDFYQEAVRTRSYSDEEGELARLVTARMEALGFDEVFIDPAGNAVGRVGDGPRILHFDSHMDTVQAGDPAAWRADPFSAEVIDGMVYGRGTVDMKGGWPPPSMPLLSPSGRGCWRAGRCMSPALCARSTVTGCAWSTSTATAG